MSLNPTRESKYHPPCSIGNYSECETKCQHPDKETCKKDFYFCRDDRVCKHYNLFDYHCCHGGGTVCRYWCWRTVNNFMGVPFSDKK